MFLGHHRHQVDPKGRVAVPAQYRRGLPEGSVIVNGNERRLSIFPPSEWEAMVETYSLRAETPADKRQLMRGLYASAAPVEFDAQGRMLLNAEQRRWAEITDRAVFSGMGNCVEVVGEAIWDADKAALTPEEFTALNDRVFARPGAAPAGLPTSA